MFTWVYWRPIQHDFLIASSYQTLSCIKHFTLIHRYITFIVMLLERVELIPKVPIHESGIKNYVRK